MSDHSQHIPDTRDKGGLKEQDFLHYDTPFLPFGALYSQILPFWTDPGRTILPYVQSYIPYYKPVTAILDGWTE